MSEVAVETEVAVEEVRVERVDAFRFDLLVDIEKCDLDKLRKDIQQALKENDGHIWWVDLEVPGDIDVEDIYASYAQGTVATYCVVMERSGGAPELTSTVTLMVRESVLAGISRAAQGTVWTNGAGDMFTDSNPEITEYLPVPLHTSVVIETGSTLTLPASVTRLKWTISMPDDTNLVHWSRVRDAIREEIIKHDWEVRNTDYNTSDVFGGAMYRWVIEMGPAKGGTVSQQEAVHIWDACLSGVNHYRLGKPESVILVRNGAGTMSAYTDRWKQIAAPGLLFVE